LCSAKDFFSYNKEKQEELQKKRVFFEQAFTPQPFRADYALRNACTQKK